MSTTACMGGRCAKRAGCCNYLAEDRSEPVERLCSPTDQPLAPLIATAYDEPEEDEMQKQEHMRWTEEETEFLRANYLTMPTRQLREELGRFSSVQIWHRASRLKLGEKRVNYTADGNWGAPPVKRHELVAMLEAAGANGLSSPELVAAEPGVNDNTVRLRILKARDLGLCYSIGNRYSMRHFASSVPRQDAEETMMVHMAEQMARSKALEAARLERYKEQERERSKQQWAASKPEREMAAAQRKAARQAKREADAQARREQKEAKAIERAEARKLARAEARKQAAIKRTAEATKVKALRGTAVSEVVKQTGPARITGPLDLSRAKIIIAPTPRERFSVEAPSAGGFSNLRPGQYAFEASSCAARAA